MTSRWRKTAETIADETFLSIREAEAVLAYESLAHPDQLLPPPKEQVYEAIAEELHLEATTVRTYLTRAQNKMGRAVATAKAVENPTEYLAEEEPAEPLSELLSRQHSPQPGTKPVW